MKIRNYPLHSGCIQLTLVMLLVIFAIQSQVSASSRNIEFQAVDFNAEIAPSDTRNVHKAASKVVNIQNGSWIRFDNFNFGTGPAGVRVLAATPHASGGTLEVRKDSPTGALLASLYISSTGGWDTWGEFRASISEVSGTTPLFLVAKGGTGYLFDLKSFMIFNAQPMGSMKGFYRRTQLQGHLVEVGQDLISIPSYLTSGVDLPVRTRGTDMEIPFTDHFSITRFLGGFKYHASFPDESAPENDVFYRTSGNQIEIRPDVIRNRLELYRDQDYQDVTIALCNIPWDLPENPKEGVWGQDQPPADWSEYYTGVRKMVEEQVRLYGYKTASKFRFKVGVEYNGTNSFDAPEEEYLKMYDWSVKAVHDVLPSAYVMPAEIGGNAFVGNVDYRNLVDHCVSGINYATGGTGTPIHGLARSSHSFGAADHDPRFRATKDINMWTTLLNHNPGLTRADVDIEIHQAGMLANEYGISTTEPGARHASWSFNYMFRTKAKDLLDGYWHWNMFDRIPLAGQPEATKYIMNGLGQLLNYLDQTEGYQTYVLQDSPADLADGTFFYSVAFAGQDETFILTASYNVDRTIRTGAWIDIDLPKGIKDLPGHPTVEYIHFDDLFSVHQAIKDDLAAAGNLKAEFNDPAKPYVLGPVLNMASDWSQAQQMIHSNWIKYENKVRQYMNFSDFNMGDYTDAEGYQRFHFWMRKTGMHVIRISHPTGLARIEAEDYDAGGQGIAYHDTTTGNTGGQYRDDDVDIETCKEGGYNIGWTVGGEWMEYTINVQTPRYYRLRARVASAQSTDKTYSVYVNGAPVAQSTFNTGGAGWQAWMDSLTDYFYLGEGLQFLRFHFNTGGFNLNWIQLEVQEVGIGGLIQIEAEDYDAGGQGIAYHDTTTGNTGGQYRDDDVDIQNCSDTGGGYNVGWTAAGEWIEYGIHIADDAAYDIILRVATPHANRKVTCYIDGTQVGQVTFNSTGGWQTYVNQYVHNISLTKGYHVLRIKFDTGGVNFNWFRLRQD